MTPAEIIMKNGGPSVVAKLVDRSPGAVRLWKHRNYFPRAAWPELMKAFRSITLNDLLQMEYERGRK
jgi:hypothetical protein